MVNPIRREVLIAEIDLSDTRLRFRKNPKEETIKAMAQSIQNLSLLNPVKLWKQGDHYVVIAGWQRIAAVKSLGHESISDEVYEGITYEEALRINVADNQLRENLSEYESACQMQILNQRDHYTAERLAELYGCGVDRVYDLLSVADMDPKLRDALERDDLNLYQAVIVGRFPPSERSEILERTLRLRLSVHRLKQELSKLKRHPLFNNRLPVGAGPQAARHALRIPLSRGFLDRLEASWRLIGKHMGLPGPTSCEFTLSTMARDCDPPYVCPHDAEWVILAYGEFPRGDSPDFDWEDVSLGERDGWFFYCERCAQLMFPDIVFHRGTSFHVWDDGESALDDEPMDPFEG
jgi:ParB/RepB/Spo0J family partition protein